ncbi:hypothetical protein B0H17DRAFT_1219299 [Mycena rosella]|uniref:G-protein coupled receptors family 2 profile 2 domain-containing protein n=1 Tax=Mycena rosella TaxID=1033263 RepID=A0AAD7BIA9_MYCRO|nr:hypothetical protein B0H17DRAFT_1219299 [Mycena rosella]
MSTPHNPSPLSIQIDHVPAHRPALSSIQRSNPGLTLGTVIPGIFLSTLLLSSIAYLACKRVSRRYLDRVSFRLLAWALVADLIFMVLIPLNMQEYPRGCGPNTFLSMLLTMFAACMGFCMALNLQLVLIHGVNGNSMEKYYIIYSCFFSLACNIPPFVVGEYGWTGPSGHCWQRNPSLPVPVQLAWLIGTQSFWLLLMSAGELFSFLKTFNYMMRQELKFRRLKRDMPSDTSPNSGQVIRQAPIVKYRSTILRIGLYPLISCFFSIMSTVLSVFATHRGSPNEKLVPLLRLLVFIFRPVVYVLLASTDPGFLCAINALRPAPPPAAEPTASQDAPFTTSATAPSGPAPPPKYPKRFSQTHRAVVFVALGNSKARRGSAANDAESIVSKEAAGIARHGAGAGGDPEIQIVEDDGSIAGQL